MTFDPLSFGMSEDAGPTPSRTVFFTQGGILNVTSNGIPYPALSDSTNVQTQNYNFRFAYRAGSNTQNPQLVANSTAGIFANGVVFKGATASTQIPGTNILAPSSFRFNTVYLEILYGSDFAGARIENGVYNYRTGKFLTQAWNTNLVKNSSQYFKNADFNGDNFRHADGHSKILGFAFDGYPIYGPYGYTFPTDRESGIKRIASGYLKLPNDDHRPGAWKYNRTVDTPQGTVTLAAGSFLEDFVYRRSLGDLDKFNGRFCVTPDFPQGTYAYFLTFEDDALTKPAYPYIVGPSTRQSRTLLDDQPTQVTAETSLWSVPTGSRLTTLIERSVVELNLPLANVVGLELEIISGE
jgi:hypothetical protein